MLQFCLFCWGFPRVKLVGLYNWLIPKVWRLSWSFLFFASSRGARSLTFCSGFKLKIVTLGTFHSTSSSSSQLLRMSFSSLSTGWTCYISHLNFKLPWLNPDPFIKFLSSRTTGSVPRHHLQTTAKHELQFRGRESELPFSLNQTIDIIKLLSPEIPTFHLILLSPSSRPISALCGYITPDKWLSEFVFAACTQVY